MLPRISLSVSTLAALTVSVLLAVTGVANNLVGFFSLVGASFGPICGVMAADYILAGKRWTRPRLGINWTGCIAWIVGFLIGIPEHMPGMPATCVKADNPFGLYSFMVDFLVYLILAEIGLRSPVIQNINTTATPSSSSSL